jgi:hypothetical protein
MLRADGVFRKITNNQQHFCCCCYVSKRQQFAQCKGSCVVFEKFNSMLLFLFFLLQEEKLNLCLLKKKDAG